MPPSPLRSSSPASSAASGSEQDEQRAVKKRRVEFLDVASEQSASSSFTIPKSLKRASGDDTLSEFGHEKLKQKLADGCELWALRLPHGFKLRHLAEASLRVPSNNRSKTEKLGKFASKKTEYEVYSVGNDAVEAAAVGGGELKGLVPLVADRKQKYSGSAIPIARHLVVKQSLSFPSSGQAADEDSAEEATGEGRQQPDGLMGYFAPYGAETQPHFSESVPAASKKSKSKVNMGAESETMLGSQSPKEKKEKKKKKRKSEVASQE